MRSRRFPPQAQLWPKAWRAAACAVLALLFSLLVIPSPPALADEKKLTATQSAWFWSSNQDMSTCTSDGTVDACVAGSVGGGVGGVTPAGQTSPITFGHIGVAMKDGSSDMRGYLQWDLGELPFGAEISSFVVRLPVSNATPAHAGSHNDMNSQAPGTGKPPATANQSNATIIACAVSEPWGPAEGVAPYTTQVVRPKPEATPPETEAKVVTVKNEPASDCGLQATGELSQSGAVWTFDITHIAKKWATNEFFNNGLALLPVSRGVSPNWTVEFHGPPRIDPVTDPTGEEKQVTYVDAKEAASATVEFTGGTPPDGTTGGTTGGTVGGDFGGTVGGGTGFVPPATDGTVVPPATTDGSVAPAPTTGGGVLVAGSARTPAWLFALIPLGLIGLGLVSNAIGPDPAWAVAGGNRVASVLRSRRVAGAEGLSEASEIASEEIAEQEQEEG